MKFRAVDIPNLIYQILRPNYAVTYGDEKTLPALNQMYKFLLACLYPLQPKWNEYDALRRKYYMIASCEPNISNVSNVLNHLFGQYGEIIISNSSLNQMYLYDSYPKDESKQVYLYTEGSENAPVYWGFQGATSNETIVRVPIELQYSGAIIYNAVSVPGGPTIAISDKTAYITNNNWLSYKTVRSAQQRERYGALQEYYLFYQGLGPNPAYHRYRGRHIGYVFRYGRDMEGGRFSGRGLHESRRQLPVECVDRQPLRHCHWGRAATDGDVSGPSERDSNLETARRNRLILYIAVPVQRRIRFYERFPNGARRA